MLTLNSKNTILKKQTLNQNIIKSILLIVMTLVILSILGIKSYGIVTPTSDFYVNDYANLLSTETKSYIMNTNINLHNKTGAQIVVVTIPSLEGSSIEDYATKLFRNFGIGDKTKNNGVLLLLALKERKFRVEVGYGLEGILPDGKTGRIQDEYIIPYLKNDNWNAGIRNGFSAILEVVANEYNVDVGGEEISKTNQKGKNKAISNTQEKLAIGGTSIMFISALVGRILRNFKRRRKIICSIIYLIISSILMYVLFISLLGVNILYVLGVNLVFFLFALSKNIFFIGGSGFSSGGFSGGSGFSGGGGFSGGRRFIWRRRKFKKFLIIKSSGKK